MAFTSPYRNTVVMGPLSTAVSNGIAQSQSGSANTALTLNGSLVTSGVANLGTTARRVIVTSAGNDSGITFTIVGTDRYGRAQTEVLTGGNNSVSSGVAQTVRDFLTVSSITPSGATASTVTAGTNSVASSAPIVLDSIPNTSGIGCQVVVSGTVTYTVESTSDDLGPDYNVNATPPNWFSEAGYGSQTTSQKGQISALSSMVRLTVNSGTGSATMTLIQQLKAGGF